jgi:hypothetical protein
MQTSNMDDQSKYAIHAAAREGKSKSLLLALDNKMSRIHRFQLLNLT